MYIAAWEGSEERGLLVRIQQVPQSVHCCGIKAECLPIPKGWIHLQVYAVLVSSAALVPVLCNCARFHDAEIHERRACFAQEQTRKPRLRLRCRARPEGENALRI